MSDNINSTNISKQDNKPIIIVIIRYSILTTQGQAKFWRIGKQSFQKYRAQMFSAKRLQLRENLFKNVTVPSLLAQNDWIGKAKVVVLTSDSLPSPYIENLHKIVEPLKCAEIRKRSIEEAPNFGREVPEVIKSLNKDGNPIVTFATIRLDDDDALSNDYFRRVSEYIIPELSGYAVSFGRGYHGCYNESKNAYYSIKEVHTPLSVGLAYIGTFDITTNAFINTAYNCVYDAGSHRNIDENVPTILDSRKPAFLYSIYDQQDHCIGKTSNQKARKRIRKVLKAIFPERKLAPTPSLIADEFKEKFGFIKICNTS